MARKTAGLSRPATRIGASESIIGVLENLEEKYLNALEVTLNAQCMNILEHAILFRESSPNKHNITGNLLTGIMVCLFRRGKLIRTFTPVDDLGVKSPIRTQMTAPNRYHFNPDYEGDSAHIKATVRADSTSFGQDQALKWVRRRYKVSRKHLFEILVVYGADYAEWVEHERGTAGFASTVSFVKAIDWSLDSTPF